MAEVVIDEGPRPTTRDGLAAVRPNLRERLDALPTAGTSSQVSDGASAVLLMTAGRSAALNLAPRPRGGLGAGRQ